MLPEQAAEALRLISRLRQSCNAFVIANAVRVRATADEIEDLMEQIEDVREVNARDVDGDPDSRATGSRASGTFAIRE